MEAGNLHRTGILGTTCRRIHQTLIFIQLSADYTDETSAAAVAAETLSQHFVKLIYANFVLVIRFFFRSEDVFRLPLSFRSQK